MTSMSDPFRELSRYRLITRLGSGGMADVYLAVTRGAAGFRRLEVLKMPRSDLSLHDRANFIRMFRDEGRLAALLNHPNIIQSHDLAFDGDCPFIAMEYLEGQSLDRILDRSWTQGGTFSLSMLLVVICQILDGLEYAHNLVDYHEGTPLRLVHRDVSPQNVFVMYSGYAKLLDFGVAKTQESPQTQAGVIKGKIGYMAPEQLRGGPIDRRADLFSVGVMLWEAVAGRNMHEEPNLLEIARKVAESDLPRIRDVVPTVSVALERIIVRALAANPDDRYPDARTLRDDLLRLPEAQGVSAREVGEKVAEMFAEERRTLDETIREGARAAGDRRSSERAPAWPSIEERHPTHVVGRLHSEPPGSATDAPQASLVPDVSQGSDVAEVSQGSDVAEVSQGSDVAEVSQGSDFAEVSQGFDLAEVSQGSDVAEMSQASSRPTADAGMPGGRGQDVDGVDIAKYGDPAKERRTAELARRGAEVPASARNLRSENGAVSASDGPLTLRIARPLGVQRPARTKLAIRRIRATLLWGTAGLVALATLVVGVTHLLGSGTDDALTTSGKVAPPTPRPKLPTETPPPRATELAVPSPIESTIPPSPNDDAKTSGGRGGSGLRPRPPSPRFGQFEDRPTGGKPFHNGLHPER